MADSFDQKRFAALADRNMWTEKNISTGYTKIRLPNDSDQVSYMFLAHPPTTKKAGSPCGFYALSGRGPDGYPVAKNSGRLENLYELYGEASHFARLLPIGCNYLPTDFQIIQNGKALSDTKGRTTFNFQDGERFIFLPPL
jgi:hypothetical protein